DDRLHAGQARGFGNIDLEDFAVRVRTAEHAPGQKFRRNQIGGILGPSGYLIRAVDHRHETADVVPPPPFLHPAPPLAGTPHTYLPASLILTYPVQRQMLLPRAAQISSSRGCGLRRSSPAEAMMNPGVQYPHCEPSFS